ncbi:MAG: DUF4105 domain-containing protein [Gemmatimonadaceae bacterium]
MRPGLGQRLGRAIGGAMLALIAGLGTADAQAPTSPTPPPELRAPAASDDLDILLLTFGLGQEVFERFGHNAIWVHDRATGTDSTYDWGNFSFRQPGFIRRFLTGDTRYSMEGRDANAMVEYYRSLGRPITVQRLNLAPQQKRALRDFLRWNALEENKYYRYDYFVDNCSTRLRDALDRTLGGALRAATDSLRTPLSYRRESVRLTDGVRPIQTGIDIALGRPADVPLTVWESFFIPMRLRDAVRGLAVPNGARGERVPLVESERALEPYPGTPRVVERATAPRLVWRLLVVGLVLGALVAGIRIMAVSRRGAVWGLAVVAAAWSLLCGVIGVILVLAWTATRHVFWAWNENLFLASPLSLLLVVLLPMTLLRGRGARATHGVTLAVLVLSLVGLVLAVLPGGQENRAIVALFLPVHVAIAWSVLRPALAAPRAAHAVVDSRAA